MGTKRLTTLFAAGALATAALAGVSVTAASAAVTPHAGSHALRPADWACYGFGAGATPQAAAIAARQDFIGNKYVGALVITKGQYPNGGGYWEQIAGDCYFVE